MAFEVNEKLELLKEKLKVWNKEVFEYMDLKIEETVKQMNLLNSLVAKGSSSDSD